jgi:hypothetical protein
VKKRLFSRRPSAALIVASAALFLSLGGVGYAAISLPRNSVGTNQIRNDAVHGSKINVLAVGYRKIQFGAVGIRRINANQVQARINGTCAANSAMTAIDNQGNATCSATAPKEFGTTSTSPTSIGTTATAVTSKALPGGTSYLVFANPQVDVSGAATGSQVEVDCTLSMSPGDVSTTQTRSVTVPGGTGHQFASMSLEIPAPSLSNGSTAAVSCVRPTTATSSTMLSVNVSTAINALQTASNG